MSSLESQSELRFHAQESLLSKHDWHSRLEEEVALATETNEELSVIFADIDRFKAVNDELGHDAGDREIVATGDLVLHIANNLRLKVSDESTTPPDLITYGNTFANRNGVTGLAGRIGGDEFGIIAPVGTYGATALKGRLKAEADEYINKSGNEILAELGVGLSVGRATLEAGMTAADLLKAADDDMYQDKIKQLPELDAEQQRVAQEMLTSLRLKGIRPRDLRDAGEIMKYVERQLSRRND